jgi:hypothetical protein
MRCVARVVCHQRISIRVLRFCAHELRLRSLYYGLAVKQLHAYTRVSRRAVARIDVRDSASESPRNCRRTGDPLWDFQQQLYYFSDGHGQICGEANARTRNVHGSCLMRAIGLWFRAIERQRSLQFEAGCSSTIRRKHGFLLAFFDDYKGTSKGPPS